MSAEDLDGFIRDNSSGDDDLDFKIKSWLAWDKNQDTHDEIRKLVVMKDHIELANRLQDRMQFGTAGLRAKLGAGFTRMNDLTIIQTAQGLCKYLLAYFKDVEDKSIVIGFDGRHGSHRFAQLSAAIFLAANIKVYLFTRPVPTPFVPYSVRKYGCISGVMVTASHNPKEDNGYKVYFQNGAQIVSPHDRGIADAIAVSLEPLSSSWKTEVCSSNPCCIDPLDEVMACYMEHAQEMCFYRQLHENSGLNITYTAMHGVGHRYVEAVFKAFSLKPFFSVTEQQEPDPNFPTVKFPNPEEGKSALNLAIKKAESSSSPLIVANDPDADRLALAEKTTSGTWKVFTGNEIGALLGWWILHCYKQKHPDALPSDSIYMLHSVVSSRILQSMAAVEGFQVVPTLTGFKWLGNKANDLTKQGKTVLFAFEEAIGFMCSSHVLDKDGVTAAAIASSMACYLYDEKMTLQDKLIDIYDRYGIHVSNNSYFICHSSATIEAIFERMRRYDDGKYPSQIGNYKVTAVLDLYGNGYDSRQPDHKPILPTSTSGQMFTFYFENDCVATIRTSGTEPKVKYYSELSGQPGDGMTKEAAGSLLQNVVDALIDELLQPQKNSLIARSD